MSVVGLAALQLAGSLGSFGLLCTFRAVWRGDRPPPDYSDGWNYNVFVRRGTWSAYRAPASFQWWDALIYVNLFYFALPLLVIRFGWRKGFVVVLVPFVGVLIGFLAEHWMDNRDPGTRIGVAFFATAFLRACVGMVIGSKAVDWRREIRIRRGWQLVGSCIVRNRKAAISTFNPPEVGQKTSGAAGPWRRLIEHARSYVPGRAWR